MTVMTTMEGITAPARAASIRTLAPTETFLADDVPLLSSRRADGWSAENQRRFLEAIAEGHGVDAASARVGLSASSAYAFRRTAKGAAFALGWRAATLVARDCVAETLLVRALAGTVDTIVRGEVTVTRHKFDNRLALSLLARLDRQAESAPDADARAARLVAQEFDAFLDLVGQDAGPARAGLFLARRAGGLEAGEGDATHDLAPIYALAAADRLVRTGVATAQEVDVADLDPAARAGWSGEQWQRAEAAGMIALAAADPEPEVAKPASAAQLSQHSQVEASVFEEEPVWWDDELDGWRTRFPPPVGFTGDENEEFGHINYERALSEEEADYMGPSPYWFDAQERADAVAARDAYFAPPLPAATSLADEEIPGCARRFESSRVHPAPSQTGVSDMADTSHDISTLNGLIATTIDSVEGYSEAAKDSDSGRFGAMFTSRAQERRKVASELQAEVSRLGGEPEDDGTVLAGAHRAFVNLKSAITGKDDKAIIDEVERGEDHIKAKFEDAIADSAISPETRSAIGAAWGSVKAGHDEMRDLKHSMER